MERSSSISSYGNTLYVGGDGPGNYTKIQDAIDDAIDGDTVFVYDDSSPYYENIVIRKPINIIGENKYSTTIDGQSISRDAIKISSNSVTLKFLTIRNSDKFSNPISIKSGCFNNSIIENIVTNNVYGILIENSYCNNISNNLIIYNDHCPIDLRNSSYNIIIGNTIKSRNDTQVQSNIQIFQNSNENEIINNIFDGNNCLLIYKSSNNHICGNIFKNHCRKYLSSSKYYSQCYYDSCNNSIIENIFENGKGGISITSKYNTVSGNIFRNLSQNCITIYNTTSIEIISNTIKNNEDDGIYIGYSSYDNIIKQNIISNNKCGIYVLRCDENVITNNNISDDNLVGITLQQSRNISIFGNHLSKNGCGIYVVGRAFDFLCKNIKILNNSIKDNFMGIYLYLSYNNTVKFNNFIDNKKNAVFEFSYRNKWKNNYWDDWLGFIYDKKIFQKFPKIIFGIYRINFDWNPAKGPYFIDV